MLAIGYWPLRPPGASSASAPDDQFSAERAFEHVRVIAREPHPMGTAAIAEVREYVLTNLQELGLAVDLQRITAPDYFGGGEPIAVINIMGRIPGTATTKAVALMGHYDTVPTTPGANDNSVAVATLLETGRALLAGPPLRNDVYLLFTDGEEPAPRYGAKAFVQHHPAFGHIGLVVNFEASGGGGASILGETSGPQAWLVRELAAADPHPAAFSVLTATTRLLGDLGTDFDAFRNAGVTGLHFAYMRGSPIYHTEADNLAAVGKASLQHHGEHALHIARHFGNLDLNDPGPADEVVFFTVGSRVVRYPTKWAMPLALLTLVAGFVAWWRFRADTGVSVLAVAGRLLRTIGAGLLGTLSGTLLWLLITAMRSTPGIVESYAYLACVLALAAFVAAKTAPRRDPVVGRIEVVWIWIALSLTTAYWRPGFSYLFTWPALAGAVALSWRAKEAGVGQTLRFALIAAPTLILTMPAIEVFFQFAQPRPGNPESEMHAAVAVPVLLALAAWGLLQSGPLPRGDVPALGDDRRTRGREQPVAR